MKNGFVKVFCKCSNGIVSEELIRVEDLNKVVKWCGNDGNGICFEWHDRVLGRERQWVYEFCSAWLRDEVFARYEKMLTGEIIRDAAHVLKG